LPWRGFPTGFGIFKTRLPPNSLIRVVKLFHKCLSRFCTIAKDYGVQMWELESASSHRFSLAATSNPEWRRDYKRYSRDSAGDKLL
jgi:hypothetical protein